MKSLSLLSVSFIAAVSLAGCASIRVAQNKTVESGGEKFELGGSFNPRGNDLTLTVNGDPIMRGRFPPFTPTLRLNATYKNQPVAASCYFGTILGGGKSGIGTIGTVVAGSIQGAKGKSGDKCDVTLGSASEALFF